MHMNLNVSVIIPCYNSAKFIEKTLNTVLDQTYKPLEFLVIDDGSTDETREILERYSLHLRILCHPDNVNLGIGASLNLGVREAKADLIAFLDADDLWHPTKLGGQVKIFATHPDVGLTYTNVNVIDENDKVLYEIPPGDLTELNEPSKILMKCYIRTASSVMVRRNLFQQTGLFRTDLLAADHDMWIRMGEKTNFYFIPEYLASHRKRQGQVSSRRKLWEDGFVILQEACKRYPYGNSVKRKRTAVLHYRLGEYDWRHNSYLSAAKQFMLSAMFDPVRSIDFIISTILTKSKIHHLLNPH